MQTQDLISAYNALIPAEQAIFQKETGLIPVPKSTKFQRTNIVVAVPAQTGTFNNKKNTSSILKLKKDGGLFDVIDGDISGWEFDNNPIYEGCEATSGVVDKFINDIKHRDIIAEGQMLKTHKKYNMWQAQLLANELVKAGAINEKNRGVIIYLTETINATSCWLDVWLNGDGRVGVNVDKVRSDSEFSAGRGVLSSN